VIQGVTHNLGFGKSIIHNESFASGDYTTAFIPKFYPNGYTGNVLSTAQKKIISLAAH
jgi:pyruvate carboxylase